MKKSIEAAIEELVSPIVDDKGFENCESSNTLKKLESII